jgi:hypothetical protein
MMTSLPGGSSNIPIWYPPISVPWILTILLLIGAANVDALPPTVHRILTHPFGFFMTFMIALSAYDSGFAPATFGILLLLLMTWSYKQRTENFQASGTVDWVTTSKKWFVEAVLKEKPMGIRDKDVVTSAVQSDNSLPSS